MMMDGNVIGDGSWKLRIYITDLKVECTLRVTGDLHIGAVILKLVEEVRVAIDWSNHAIWWPIKNIWLLRTRSTLDKYGVQADAVLHFTSIHKNLRIQMPDLQYVNVKTDFTRNSFYTVIEICDNLGIRHPEELSLCKPLHPEHLKDNYNKLGCTGNQCEKFLTSKEFSGSLPNPSKDSKQTLLYPKNLVERARLNAGWLDSSLSLMEQDVRENDTLLLKFKYFCFMDIDPKLDSARINQLYEQAKWSILTEAIDCTEEEMMVFSGLQLQASLPQPDPHRTLKTDLQSTSEGTHLEDLTHIPQLSGYLLFMKPKKINLKGFQKFYAILKFRNLSFYKDASTPVPFLSVDIKGSQVTPDLDLSQNKFGIHLEVPNHEGMAKYLIQCDSKEMYAKWMAACRLTAQDRTLEDTDYENEVQSILEILNIQKLAQRSPFEKNIGPEECVAPRFIKKRNHKQLTNKIIEAHAKVKDMAPLEAKLHYIKAWQRLPEYGMSLFVIKVDNKEELFGISFNRFMRMELTSGNPIKTWRYSTMKTWDIKWEINRIKLQLEEEEVIFKCLSAGCKVIHEFLSGYICLSMRNKEQGHIIEKSFLKLAEEVPNHEGMAKYLIQCDSKEMYDKWMAACRLTAQDRTLADTDYENEVQSILEILNIQKLAQRSPFKKNIGPEECVAPRFIKKRNHKQLTNKILEAHAKVKDMAPLEAKLHYIKAWQRLPEYGMSLFVIKVDNMEELFGISFNRFMRMELTSGNPIKTWRYSTMKTWDVKWEINRIKLQLEEEEVIFKCLSAGCKVIHEFLSGYICLSMRNKEKGHIIEKRFLKLAEEVPNHEGMAKYLIQCDSKEMYAKWMTACRLTAQDRTLADTDYENEVQSILDILNIQKLAQRSPFKKNIGPEECVAPRFIKKRNHKKLTNKILEAHALSF
ncbi:FERMT2 [Cordylochernes scorpioides]|uniref:FERMT2 n=1 Tax=Cordylochernes scorpioides TaxID=51811 RepID=A0ABY6K0H9_9ARAC|nr:FERMT2 [Cordylochernes scorpioides]